MLDEESETFVVYVAALETSSGLAWMTMHPSRAAQIAALKQDETFIKVSSKYTNYADVFSFDLAIKLPENIGINNYAIKLEKRKQPLYRPIYSLGPIKLKTLKIYIHRKIFFLGSGWLEWIWSIDPVDCMSLKSGLI